MLRLLILLLLVLPPDARAELQISDAWIRDLPPSIPVRAGYLTLHNPATAIRVINAIDSPAFARIEIHRSFEQDGAMKMERIDRLPIAAGARLRLEPGGLHLMMFDAVAPVRPGDVIGIRLLYADGSTQTLEMGVKKDNG